MLRIAKAAQRAETGTGLALVLLCDAADIGVAAQRAEPGTGWPFFAAADETVAAVMKLDTAAFFLPLCAAAYCTVDVLTTIAP
jgi:hypothetical protein